MKTTARRVASCPQSLHNHQGASKHASGAMRRHARPKCKTLACQKVSRDVQDENTSFVPWPLHSSGNTFDLTPPDLLCQSIRTRPTTTPDVCPPRIGNKLLQCLQPRRQRPVPYAKRIARDSHAQGRSARGNAQFTDPCIRVVKLGESYPDCSRSLVTART